MSEPLTSHEIEDVLSSIRRLVSEDLRPAARAATVAAPAGSGADEAGKLLLTPALRVVPDPAPEPPAPKADTPTEVPQPVAVLHSDDVAFLPDDLAAPAAAYDDDGWNSADAAAFTPDPQPLDDMSAPAAAAPAPERAADTSPAPETWDDGSDLIWSSVGAPPDPAEDEAETIVPLPPASEPQGHWTAQDVPGMDWVQDESDWVEPEPMPFVAHPRKPALADDPLARAWADKAEAEVRANLGGAAPRPDTAPPPRPESAAAATAPEQPGPGLFDGAEAEIDEETLRDIVRDIIREELAGTLGERITRNVRKLVRVEINRALTAREFE